MFSRTFSVFSNKGAPLSARQFMALAWPILAVTLAQARAQDFHDSFEGNAIDPYWTVHEVSGFAELSTDSENSGQQSIKLVSVSTGQQKLIQLQHSFPDPIYGRVSIWVYDTGADQASSNYLKLWVSNTTLGLGMDIEVEDYDLGLNNGGAYYYTDWKGNGYNSLIDRTQAWHHWEVESCPDFYAVRIDGQTVYTDTLGIPFDDVAFGMTAPSWRPEWVAYFDDFDLATCVRCDGITRFKADCRLGTLTAKVRSSLPKGTELMLDNNGDFRTVTINARGKAKGTWTGQSGSHTVSVAECPELLRQTSCD